MNRNFREFILITLGKLDAFSHTLSDEEWNAVYIEAMKQCIAGVLFAGLGRLPKEQKPNKRLIIKWLAQVEYIKSQNEKITSRAAELYDQLEKDGIKSLVLKGQGVAQLYHLNENEQLKPELRTSGDIDIWLEGGRERVLSYIADKGWKHGRVVVHHVDVEIYPDAAVEIHFIPTFSYNPFRYRKFKKWFKEQERSQFSSLYNKVDFAYPSVSFNLVYSLLHVFKHVFHEGIGLRQILDYYFILIHSTAVERKEAFDTLKWFGLSGFAAAIMFVEKEMFHIDDEYLLCEPCETTGQFIIDEIIADGNFGKNNNKLAEAHQRGGIALYLFNVSRLLKMLKYYPSEVVWSPIWKPAHWLWRKYKGY